MPGTSFTLIAPLLVGIGGLSWYLSSANDKTKEVLLGRNVLLERDLQERLTRLHGRFRERMFFISEGRSEAHSAEEIEQWEEFELEQWKKMLDNEWDSIASRFHCLYQARHTSKTWCFVASYLGYLNITMVLISLAALVISAFSARWQPLVTVWLPRMCAALVISSCILCTSILVGKLRERQLEGAASGDV